MCLHVEIDATRFQHASWETALCCRKWMKSAWFYLNHLQRWLYPCVRILEIFNLNSCKQVLRRLQRTNPPAENDAVYQYLNCRRRLVNWVANVCSKFKLKPLTVHVAVQHMDRGKKVWELSGKACDISSGTWSQPSLTLFCLAVLLQSESPETELKHFAVAAISLAAKMEVGTALTRTRTRTRTRNALHACLIACLQYTCMRSSMTLRNTCRRAPKLCPSSVSISSSTLV